MGRFHRFRKILSSVNMILISAVFIACAVYTVNVLAEENTGALLVKYEGFPISSSSMAEYYPKDKDGVELPEYAQHVYAPGYNRTSNVTLKNCGTSRALVEILIPEIYLTRDKYGDPLPTPQPAPPGYVNISVNFPSLKDDGTPMNSNYINNIEDYMYMYVPRGLVLHVVLRDKDGKIARHFLEFDRAYDTDEVKLEFQLSIDMKTRANEMTNEWNNARIENFGFKAALAGQLQDILTKLDLTEEEYYSLELAAERPGTRSFSIMPL